MRPHESDIDWLRRHHAEMRLGLRHLSDATDSLELRGELENVVSACSAIQIELGQHLARGEWLATQLWGSHDPVVVELVHRSAGLRQEAAQLCALAIRIEKPDPSAVDDLIVSARRIHQTIACHLCHEANKLLPLMSARGAETVTGVVERCCPE